MDDVVVLPHMTITLAVEGDSQKAAIEAAGCTTPTPIQIQAIPVAVTGRDVLGKASAPATLVEYIDLQCPVCKAASTQTLPALIEILYGDKGAK